MDILYHCPVVTCAEASLARGISINEELKTILLKISHKKVSLHIRGGDKINSKAIKKIFNNKRIRFLSIEELRYFNLNKGLVNPWNIQFCEYNLISINIFEQKFMYTNNSKYTEGVKFPTKELFHLSNIIIGDFGYESE